jgi:hypothetical protein
LPRGISARNAQFSWFSLSFSPRTRQEPEKSGFSQPSGAELTRQSWQASTRPARIVSWERPQASCGSLLQIQYLQNLIVLLIFASTEAGTSFWWRQNERRTIPSTSWHASVPISLLRNGHKQCSFSSRPSFKGARNSTPPTNLCRGNCPAFKSDLRRVNVRGVKTMPANSRLWVSTTATF